MFVTSIGVLRSKIGYTGNDLLHLLVCTGPESLFSRFLANHSALANSWVGKKSFEPDSLNSEQLAQLISPKTISGLANQLCTTDTAIQQNLIKLLFQATQLSSPDGERVHVPTFKALERDVEEEKRQSGSRTRP